MGVRMRAWASFGLALLLLSGCGDSNAAGARTAGQVCDEICGWPDACFVQLGVPVQAAECIQSCEARTNYLMFTREMELKVDPERAFHATTISRQAPFKLEYIDGISLKEDRVLLERMIQDRVSSAGNGAVAPPSAPETVEDFL